MRIWKKLDAAMCDQERREAQATLRKTTDPKRQAELRQRVEVLRRQADRLRKN